MFPKLHFIWRSSRRASPADEQHSRVGDPATVVSPPRSVAIAPLVGVEANKAGLGEPRHLNTHWQAAILSTRFSPDGRHITVAGKDGMIQRWKVEQGSDSVDEVEKLVYSEGGLNAAVVSRDSRWIVLAGTQSRTLTVWDTRIQEKVAQTMEAHEQEIIALDVSPNASMVASGSRDGAVIIWCLETGQRLAGPFKQGRPVLSLRFSPTGEYLASAGWHYLIRIWNMYNDGECLTCTVTDPVYSLAWSNEGRRLFAGCHRGSIMCFDVSISVLTTLKQPGRPHVDSISTLCVSNNGKFVVSCSSSESCLKIWDAHTLFEIVSLPHNCESLHVETSSDDGYLVIGGKEGQICIWNLRKVLPMSYFSHSLTAHLTSPYHSNSRPTLTNVSNAAYVSWRKPELAEEILSSEITRSSSPLHYTLANRALVRARLRQWDKAFDDAQASLNGEPSLMALLAKGISQFGLGLNDVATETLDQALETCDQEEKDFVNVIKAIALFDTGLRDEAICHLTDLVDHSPSVKDPCRFVQAKMHASLASEAMNDRDYFKAIHLFAQARHLCPSGQYPELDTISFISGWYFDGLRLAIYRQSCETLRAVKQMHEVIGTLDELESSFRGEITLRRELNEWLAEFKSKCAKILEDRGDEAMASKNYERAVTQYSMALNIIPASLLAPTLFVKRSEARMGAFSWEDALNDADEAIKLVPSSPWGHERRHAVLHRLERYEEAIFSMKTMVSVLEESPDPEIRALRSKYIHPSDTKKAILKVFAHSVHNAPFRLIDTTSGRLCNAEARMKIFKEDPIFQELVSSMTNELHRERIDTVTKQYLQYVMLSHRWEEKELELADVVGKSVYELEASPSATKLQRFCTLVWDAKFRWAWSDTCCIDKDKDVEFEKSINSMFHWYRRSVATLVYLTGVPPQNAIRGALKGSIWMRRGWTLQELLAPPVIRFYYEDWTPYLNDTSLNHKESPVIMQELEDATGVLVHDLLAFHPGPENAQVKLRLASTRETTVPVDMAYGLFGIFGITMPVIHGESQQHALGRLFREIVAQSGDVPCLAWLGRSSEFNSAFPDHIRVYQHPCRTVPCIGEDDMERAVIDLQRAWTVEEEAQAMAFYDGLRKLPPTRCIHQCIHLPCIVFPVTALRKVKRTDARRMYRATASALEDTEISTEDKLPTQGSQDLVLACPWIHELLDSTPPCQGYHLHHHQPSGDAESLEDSDSVVASEPDPERDTSAREVLVTLGPQSASTASVLPPPDAPLPRHPNLAQTSGDAALGASRLVVRFRQALGALLLLAQGRGQYMRVATDCDIVICVRQVISLDDMDVQTLGIL